MILESYIGIHMNASSEQMRYEGEAYCLSRVRRRKLWTMLEVLYPFATCHFNFASFENFYFQLELILRDAAKMDMSQKSFVLFYSKFCEYSQKVISLLNTSPLRSRTLKICVDDKPRSALPSTIQAVPTIIDRLQGDVFVGQSILRLFAAVDAQSAPGITPQGPGARMPPPQINPGGSQGVYNNPVGAQDSRFNPARQDTRFDPGPVPFIGSPQDGGRPTAEPYGSNQINDQFEYLSGEGDVSNPYDESFNTMSTLR